MIRLLLIALILTSVAHAQWSTDPSNNLIVGHGLLPEACSDSAGGAYVTYENNTVYPRQVELRRVNRYGDQPWASSRIIQGLWPETRYAQIVSDGQGGVLIAYVDRLQYPPPSFGAYHQRVRVQRVDSSGTFLWGQYGVRVSLAEHTQSNNQYPAVIPDGTNGCIVMWLDTLNALRVQRFDGMANRLWGDSGMYVATTAPTNLLIPDGAGGCFLVYSGPKIQHIDSSGNKLWGIDGIQINDMGVAKIAGDGSGGAVLAGMKYISYNNGDPLWAAKAQRVDSLGQFVWGTNGATLADSIQGAGLSPPGVALAVNTDHGGTIAWGRKTSPDTTGTFVQRVRGHGSLVYSRGGIFVSPSSSLRSVFLAVSSEENSTIIVWTDDRAPSGTYAQRIDSTGERCWDSSRVAISLPTLTYESAVTDGASGMIVIGFHEDFSIRAQQVNRIGILGLVITSVAGSRETDLPNQPELLQNFPNPFNPQTRIRFTLPRSERITLTLYNILGQSVKLITSGVQDAGVHSVVLDAHDLPSGVYLYRLKTPQTVLTRKLIILK